MMLSVNPGLLPTQIKAALQSTARPFPATGAAADVLACRAPNGVEQLECYCTTSTCGAGSPGNSPMMTLRVTSSSGLVA